MHSSIQKVPALVLDCEPDIDFNRDIEAKQEYARQVAEFFEFVKSKKEDCGEEDEMKSNQAPLLMAPHKNLWMPGTVFSRFGSQAIGFQKSHILLNCLNTAEGLFAH
ncbi:hypothetical protein CASFOL_012639 [Castilleja foliolosa]|uniref:Uncharacterized protein n=1 Tax=Castilleja foliolosa TaxID=1961234 RepID=A0ABD3DL55_9LAMI